MQRRRMALAVAGVSALLLCFVSCSSGPRPPQPGTPAYHWANANEAYKIGDYLKTNDSLALLIKQDSEYGPRARSWSVITAAGIARGLCDLADIYEEGAKFNRANPMAFRKQVNAFRASANAAVLQFAESFHRLLETDKDANIAIEFQMPPGNGTEPAALQKVRKGMPIPDAELAAIRNEMIARGIMLSAASAVGAGKDIPKATEALKSGQIPRETFLLNMSRCAFEASDLYSAKKMDNPNRMKLLSAEAQEALATMPQNKEAKDLLKKIQAQLKKAKVS